MPSRRGRAQYQHMKEGRTQSRAGTGLRNVTTARDDRHLVCIAVTDRTVSTIVESTLQYYNGCRPICVNGHRRIFRSGLVARMLLRRLPYNDGRIRVRCYCGERNLRACIVELHSGQTPSVMVWGAIGYNMRSRLLRIQRNLNSNRYIREVLEREVLPSVQATPHAIFQQDNARPHMARIVQAFFEERQFAELHHFHLARYSIIRGYQNPNKGVPEPQNRILHHNRQNVDRGGNGHTIVKRAPGSFDFPWNKRQVVQLSASRSVTLRLRAHATRRCCEVSFAVQIGSQRGCATMFCCKSGRSRFSPDDEERSTVGNEYADIVYVYGLCDGNATAAVLAYQARFPNRRIPSAQSYHGKGGVDAIGDLVKKDGMDGCEIGEEDTKR
ncbi:hypothetical protein ANN_15373 [Periplaneta americana]|uniref:DUF4817 domain-containing protein n=1 Tax=Periplaneta americana TaxID=6978 RepID=A0ABQ8SHD7_PERAM|nr:hypothetical protein ANN_15373 [Periplaneta americana]